MPGNGAHQPATGSAAPRAVPSSGPAARSSANAANTGNRGNTRNAGKAANPGNAANAAGTAGWTAVASPNAPGSSDNGTGDLENEACATASDCWAVGGSRPSPAAATKTLAEHWNGSTWAIVATPDTGGTGDAFLYGVTCTGASDCWAVGTSKPSASAASKALTEHWNGSAWAIVATPGTNATDYSYLYGVKCTGTSDCWAVGSVDTSYGYGCSEGYPADPCRTLTEHWDGSAWAIVASPNLSSAPSNALASVACVSAADCWAVGTSTVVGGVFQTLTEHWDGRSWAMVASPNTSYNAFASVACASTANCWAVGYTVKDNKDQTLTEHWDGSSWTVVASPDTSTSQPNYLAGVACVSSSDCWAVGAGAVTISSAGAPFPQTLTEHWNGSAWAVASSPDTPAAGDNVLLGVTCTAASSCLAVGHVSYNGSYLPQTLSERLDGNGWSLVSSPNPPSPLDSTVFGTTCVSATDCWAVGSAFGVKNQTLTEHWNGTTWAVVPSPNPSQWANSAFDAVTCASAADCWAVGYSSGYSTVSYSAPYQTLTEHWNGTSWTVVPSPNPTANGITFGVFYDAACVSAADCWAVGNANGSNGSQALTEHWDGSTWTIVPALSQSYIQGSSGFQGVTCVSTSDCWAAGWTVPPSTSQSQPRQAFTEHWNGFAWLPIPSPSSSSQDTILNGVACASTSDCWSVGYALASSPGYQGVTEHWNGITWATVPAASPAGATASPLYDVACPATSSCSAVGGTSGPAGVQTLTEQWDGNAWAVTGSASPGGAYNFLRSVSCVAAADCWAVGYSGSSGQRTQTLIEHYS